MCMVLSFIKLNITLNYDLAGRIYIDAIITLRHTFIIIISLVKRQGMYFFAVYSFIPVIMNETAKRHKTQEHFHKAPQSHSHNMHSRLTRGS